MLGVEDKMLKPAQIKPFLSHPEGVIREFTVNYFAKSFSLDPELLPLILKYTRMKDSDEIHPDDEDANKLMLDLARCFIQTEETFMEILRRFESADQYKSSYVQLLLNAGPHLLKKYLPQLVFYPELKKVAEQTVELIHRPTSELWKRLMEYSEVHAEEYVGEFDFNYGVIMVRELAGRPDLPRREIRQILTTESEDNGVYKEIYLTILAGDLHDEAWIPVLIDKLSSGGDIICKNAADALAKIGTPAVAEALYERYREKDGYYSIFAAPLLGQIKTKNAEDAILKLLAVEEDYDDAVVLADSLGQLLSVKGIPWILKYVKEGYSSCVLSLEKTLYCNSVINCVELEDIAKYRQMLQDEREEFRIRSAEYNRRKTLYDKAKPVVKPDKIGRNDTCPCGSGKKFKKCCRK
ncbi:MAG: SEC-C metal-binding domain-containing protein [Desulfitobacteriaceae bacterium]|nr:SEC-C metal-binding domain-containing protein [Desulfitobacteriaceae bacterium]MDD4346952.1 SEC-C metal-binding domain-containing protein [Desulfitobacteriaceae bacterium]MDD4402208.1 SEC-C metal-binding domain-containing protein [Desulfitobacteriaceae bacterium]